METVGGQHLVFNVMELVAMLLLSVVHLKWGKSYKPNNSHDIVNRVAGRTLDVDAQQLKLLQL